MLSQLGDFQHLGRTRRALDDHLLEDLVGDDVKGLVLALVLVIAGLCLLVILLLLLLCCSCRRRKPDLEEGKVEGVEKVEEKGEEGMRKGRERKSRERRSRERRSREENHWTSESSETSPAGGGLQAQYYFPPRRTLGPPIWVPPSPENLNSSGAVTPRSSTGLQAIWNHSDSSAGWCPGPPCGAQKILEPTSLL